MVRDKRGCHSWQPFFLLILKDGENMANVKVRALKPLGIKVGKETVDKAPGAEFEMDFKDALAAEKDQAVQIVSGKNKQEENDAPVDGFDEKEEKTVLKAKAKELGIPKYTKMKAEELFEAIILKQSENVAKEAKEQAVEATTQEHTKIFTVVAENLGIEINEELGFEDAIDVLLTASQEWKKAAEASGEGKEEKESGKKSGDKE